MIQAQTFGSDFIYLYHLTAGGSSLSTLYSTAVAGSSNFHGGNVLVYGQHSLALTGNNPDKTGDSPAPGTFARLESGSHDDLTPSGGQSAYQASVDGGEIPLFSIASHPFAVIPEASGTSLMQIKSDNSFDRIFTIAGDVSTNTQTLGLAIFHGQVLIINGHTRSIHQLQLS